MYKRQIGHPPIPRRGAAWEQYRYELTTQAVHARSEQEPPLTEDYGGYYEHNGNDEADYENQDYYEEVEEYCDDEDYSEEQSEDTSMIARTSAEPVSEFYGYSAANADYYNEMDEEENHYHTYQANNYNCN